jgi:hypothetical protein
MKIIRSVTSDGISYLDDNGIEAFVDFKQCSENWIQYRKRSEKLNDEKANELKKSSKCVGQRDICAKPCYIELFKDRSQGLSLPNQINFKTQRMLFVNYKMKSFLPGGQHLI